jgi:hypothetical protein
MKPLRLKIHNVGLIEDTVIEINKPLLLFYGDIRQGKTTILNCVRWVLGASNWPEDIIRHGADEASIEFEFDGGVVSRSWYRSKAGKSKGTTQARETTFIRNGRPVERPAGELSRLVNPFLVDHEYLKKMSEGERRQYFVDSFPVDTKDLDTESFNNDKEATELRAKVRGYGQIDLTPVPATSTPDLKRQLSEARAAHAAGMTKLVEEQEQLERKWRTESELIEDENEKRREQNRRNADAESSLRSIKARIAALEAEAKKAIAVMQENPVLALAPKPEKPEALVQLARKAADYPITTPELEKLQEAVNESTLNDERRKVFLANKAKAEQKEREEKRVQELEARAREIKKERVARLSKCAEVVPGLSFAESGQFTFEGTDAGMLSTSQIMRLSEMLSALYPEGFGLSLIDRAESMGKSIFEFVDRAKAEKKTILATIVGEAPAAAPAEVGVFVVDQGKVTSKQTELI